VKKKLENNGFACTIWQTWRLPVGAHTFKGLKYESCNRRTRGNADDSSREPSSPSLPTHTNGREAPQKIVIEIF